MFRALLRAQGGLPQALGAAWVVGFGVLSALPVLALRVRDAGSLTMLQIEAIGSTLGLFSNVMSVTLGLFAAVATWSPDEQGKHVYALSLPVSRGQYVLLRLGIGGLVIVGCVGAQWVMLSIVGAWASPPAPVRSYAGLVAARALVVATMAFLAASWAWQVAGTPWVRRLGPGTKVVAALAAIGLMIGVLSADHPIAGTVRDALVADWSPLRLLLANWSLFDA